MADKKAKRDKPTITQELGVKVQEMPLKSITALCKKISGKSGSYLAVMDHLKREMREPLGDI
jgi:hypothetical protein